MKLFTQLCKYLLHNLLILATLCFICGAWLARHIYDRACQPSVPLLVSGAIFTGAGLIYFLAFAGAARNSAPADNPCSVRWNWLALTALVPAIAMAGFLHTWLALQPPAAPDHIYNLVHDTTVCTLQGTVTGLVRQGPEKTSFTLTLSHFMDRQQVNPVLRPARGKVQLSLRGQPPAFLQSGTNILVLAKVHKIYNYQTPGCFDYVLHMRNRGIYCSGWLRSDQAIIPIDTPTHISLYHRLQRFRQRLSRFLETRLDPVSAGLYQALLIGDKSRLVGSTVEHFITSGCMHLLAISGLHLGLLGLALYQICIFLFRRSTWLMLHGNIYSLAALCSLPPLMLYTVIAGQAAPVLRALIMTVFVAAAFLFHCQKSLLHLLCAAALLLLVIRPLSLFTASFQLSFAAMLGILLLFPMLRSCYERLALSKSAAACGLHPPGFPGTRDGNGSKHATTGHAMHSLARLLLWPANALALSLAATAATLPLLLFHFDRFSTIGPVMNLVIEPLLCLVALPLGLLGALCLPWLPGLAGVLFPLGSHALVLADRLTEQAAHIPLAMLWTIKPSLPEIVVYGVILLLVSRPVLDRRWRIPVVAALSVGLLLHFTAGLYLPHHATKARVSFLDVGHGSATLLEFADGTATLIDGGGPFSSHFNVGERIIAPYLWKRRRWRIDSLIITHPDSDHYNGLAFIIRHFHPATVYCNGQRNTPESYARLMQTIRSQAPAAPEREERDISIHTPMPGEILHNDGRLCRLTNLGMPGLIQEHASDNNQSLVTKLICANVAFLFPADIETEAEQLLVSRGAPLKADVLLAPHHGSKTSSSRSFLAMIDPDWIIISGKRHVADSGKWSLPENTAENSPEILVTGRDGTIICTTDGKQVQVRTWAKNL